MNLLTPLAVCLGGLAWLPRLLPQITAVDKLLHSAARSCPARRGEPPARVQELSGSERDQAWRHMVRTWPNYQKYAERTERTIPGFYLDPVP